MSRPNSYLSSLGLAALASILLSACQRDEPRGAPPPLPGPLPVEVSAPLPNLFQPAAPTQGAETVPRPDEPEDSETGKGQTPPSPFVPHASGAVDAKRPPKRKPPDAPVLDPSQQRMPLQVARDAERADRVALKESIEAMFRKRSRAFELCFGILQRRRPEIATAVLRVDLQFEPDGSCSAANLLDSTVEDASLQSCVIQVLRRCRLGQEAAERSAVQLSVSLGDSATVNALSVREGTIGTR